MPATEFITVAPAGSTGNNVHAGVGLPGIAHLLAIAFICEVAGATPTVTWKVQGAVDPLTVLDANAAWVDLPYVTPATDTLAQATIARTAVGEDLIWLAQSAIRLFRRIRLVTTANTNVTYRCEAHAQYRH